MTPEELDALLADVTPRDVVEYPGATVHLGDCLDVLRELPSDSIAAIVTDPPYGLANVAPSKVATALTAWAAGDRERVPDARGFMGHRWDSFVPPPGVWDECLRVLKPGGHLLAFASSRTHDLMGLSIRFAGFEIRDGLAWLYGQGFPKGPTLDAAMRAHVAGDREVAARVDPRVYEVTAYLRDARDAAGWTNPRIDAHFGRNGMASHWTTGGLQPACPSFAEWETLKGLLAPHLGDAVDPLVAELAAVNRPDDWGSASERGDHFLETLGRVDAPTARGWSTALKPAFEPITVARKPLPREAGRSMNLEENVRKYGTGALHIGACRVPFANPADLAETTAKNQHADFGSAPGGANVYGDFSATKARNYEGGSGRWPANVILDETQAATLDGQAEGASRFFYCAKASKAERPVAPDGTRHSTVKPLALMRWLVRLVTPPGGVVLDPFAGSGTTLEAAVLEGVEVIGVEREPRYLPLIEQRLERSTVGPDDDLLGLA